MSNIDKDLKKKLIQSAVFDWKTKSEEEMKSQVENYLKPLDEAQSIADNSIAAGLITDRITEEDLRKTEILLVDLMEKADELMPELDLCDFLGMIISQTLLNFRRIAKDRAEILVEMQIDKNDQN